MENRLRPGAIRSACSSNNTRAYVRQTIAISARLRPASRSARKRFVMPRTSIHILLVRSIRAAFDASRAVPLSCRVPPRNRDRLDSCRAPQLESRGNGFPLVCGCSSMVEQQLPKLNTRVRFPSPAPSPHYTEPMDFRRPARLRGIRGCSTKLCTRCRRPPAIEACASDRTRRGVASIIYLCRRGARYYYRRRLYQRSVVNHPISISLGTAGPVEAFRPGIPVSNVIARREVLESDSITLAHSLNGGGSLRIRRVGSVQGCA